MGGDPRGILYPARMPTFTRLPAPEPVAALVRWFWIPEWALAPGRTSRQQVLAFPACNLVVEHAGAYPVGLAGPTTRLSYRDLHGTGWAVGALLRPAAVPHLTDDPGALRDTYRALALPDLHDAVAAAMTGPGEDGVRRARAVTAFADWIAAQLPAPDEEGRLANELAERVDADPTLLRVEDVASALGVSVRTVQRLAARYVGLPPSAMIRRRRLQEAAVRLREDPTTDIATVAADLGYADHAHLSSDFRTVLGFTPSGYRRESTDRSG